MVTAFAGLPVSENKTGSKNIAVQQCASKFVTVSGNLCIFSIKISKVMVLLFVETLSALAVELNNNNTD